MPEPAVVITGKGQARVLRGHPWVFRTDVARTDSAGPGAVVRVIGPRGRPLGHAFYSSRSEIRLTTFIDRGDGQWQSPLRQVAVEAASADMSWKAVHRYSQDYIELQEKHNVKFYRTPNAVLQRQLVVYDQATVKRKDNAMWVEIEQSQKRFAQRAVKWQLDTQIYPTMAYNHYLGKPAAPEKKKA